MKRRHKHRWSKHYFGIFINPIHFCLAKRCSAVKYAITGRIQERARERAK